MYSLIEIQSENEAKTTTPLHLFSIVLFFSPALQQKLLADLSSCMPFLQIHETRHINVFKAGA